MSIQIRGLLVIILWSIPSFLMASPDAVGVLDAFDPPLTVVRDGEAVPSSSVDSGFVFENADQIKVGAGGSADISLDSKTGIKASLHLRESTVINLDISSLVSQGQTGALDLMAGSVSLKVQKLLGGNRLDVHTATAAMGVRGTEFAVDTEVDGSVLLTTTEGRVELSPDQGSSHFSVPGTAVSGGEDEPGGWKETPVENAEVFAAGWRQERQEWFLAHREQIVAAVADRYSDLTVRFEAANRRLEENKALFDRWAREEKEGRRGAGAAEIRTQRRIEADLAAVREWGWALERVHHRLGMIETRLGPEAFAALQVPLTRGNWASFVRDYHDRREIVEHSLWVSHYRVKLYALRQGGRFPRVEKPLLQENAPIRREPVRPLEGRRRP